MATKKHNEAYEWNNYLGLFINLQIKKHNNISEMH